MQLNTNELPAAPLQLEDFTLRHFEEPPAVALARERCAQAAAAARCAPARVDTACDVLEMHRGLQIEAAIIPLKWAQSIPRMHVCTACMHRAPATVHQVMQSNVFQHRAATARHGLPPKSMCRDAAPAESALAFAVAAQLLQQRSNGVTSSDSNTSAPSKADLADALGLLEVLLTRPIFPASRLDASSECLGRPELLLKQIAKDAHAQQSNDSDQHGAPAHGDAGGSSASTAQPEPPVALCYSMHLQAHDDGWTRACAYACATRCPKAGWEWLAAPAGPEALAAARQNGADAEERWHLLTAQPPGACSVCPRLSSKSCALVAPMNM